MPAKSKAQFRYMAAACHGRVRGARISPKQACEYIKGQSPKGLPERKGSKSTGQRKKS